MFFKKPLLFVRLNLNLNILFKRLILKFKKNELLKIKHKKNVKTLMFTTNNKKAERCKILTFS